MPNKAFQVVLELVDRLSGGMDGATKKAVNFSNKVEDIDQNLDKIDRTVTTNVDADVATAESKISSVDMKADAVEQARTTPIDANTTSAESHIKTVNSLADSVESTRTIDIKADISQAEANLDALEDSANDLNDAIAGAGAGLTSTAIADGIMGQSDALAMLRSQVQGYNSDLENTAIRIYQVSGSDWSQVTGATAALTNQQGLLGDELQNSAVQAIAFSDVFGEDIVNVVTANTNIVRNFGISSSEGFDIMTATAQATGRDIGDVVDTFTEYSVYFNDLGYSADDMANMMASASDKGVRNLDYFGDAVKEFYIRVNTSTEDAKKGFEALGASTEQQEKWTAAMKEGGPAANQATTEIVTALMSIEDPIKRNEAGVALFGTKWEDVGDAIGESMLDGSDHLGNFEGRANEVADNSVSSIGGSIDMWARNISSYLGGAVAAATEFSTEFALIGGSMAGNMITWEGVKKTAIAATKRETYSNIAAIIKQKATTAGSTAVELAGTAATKARGAATRLSTAATNGNVIATVRAKAATVAGTVASVAATAASKAMAAAQWLLNAALNANPISIIIIAIIALVTILYILYQRNETVRNAIDWLFGALKQLGGYIVAVLTPIWNYLSAAMGGAASYIMGAWGNTVSWFQGIFTRISALWQEVVNYFNNPGTIGGAIYNALKKIYCIIAGCSPGIVPALQWLWEIASIVFSAMASAVAPFWSIISMVGSYLSTQFILIWTTIYQVIQIVINYIMSFIGLLVQLIEGNISFTDFVIQAWILLQSSIGQLLTVILDGIMAFVANMINYATAAGLGFLVNIILYISQLPGQAWAYLLSFLMYLANLHSQATSYALQVGSTIVNSIASYLSSLPGRMYNWGITALDSFINAIIDSIPGLRTALDAVSSLFPHSPPKEGPLSDITEKGMKEWLTSIVDAGKEAMDEFNLDDLNTSFPVTAQVESTQTATEGIEDPTQTMDPETIMAQSEAAITAANNTNTGVSTAYNTMESNVVSALSNMVTTDQASWMQIQSNNTSNLNSIRDSTISVTNQLISAWSTMASNIVSSANTIRTQSSGHISNLSVNIKTFYNKLINPSSWFAGPGPISKGGSVKRSVSYAGSGLAGVARTPLDILNSFKYIDPPCDNCYAGSWDVSTPNISRIKSTIGNYPVNMPDITGLYVNDFANTTNPLDGSLKLFEAVANKLIDPTVYDFYYNGRYSNLEAIRRGAFNCYDGAEILIALGQAMGLSSYMVHGSWNGIGHVAANVGGRIFDTTQKQQRGVWRGSTGVSFGPGPLTGFGINGTNQSDSYPETITIQVEDNVNFTIDLKNVPENIDEASLISVLKKIITDSEILNKLIKNRDFMDILRVELGKSLKRQERKGGSAS